MPQLAKVITPDELLRRPAGAGLDLGRYTEMIDLVAEHGGVGGVVSLEEGESQRTEKRRLSVAARERGYDLVWRAAPEGQLRFMLAKAGERPPDARPRRNPAEQQAEQTVVEAVMTPDVAEVTDTTAPGEAQPPAAPRGRGRTRS